MIPGIVASAGSSPSLPIGLATFSTQAGTGTMEIVAPEMGAIVPKVALFFLTNADPSLDPADTPNMVLSVGACDGSAQWGGNYRDAGAADTALSRDDECLVGFLHAEFSEFIAGGVRLDVIDGDETDLSTGWCLLLGGDDVQATVGTLTLNGDTSPESVAGLPFQPDLVLLCAFDDVFDGTARSGQIFRLGMATATEQKSVSWGPAGRRQVLRTNRVLNPTSSASGSQLYNLTCAINSDGFTVTPSASRSDKIGYVALKFAGKSFKLVDHQTPTSTGTQAFTGVGFTPELVLGVQASQDVRDPAGTVAAEDDGEALGFFGFTAGRQRASASYWESASGNGDKFEETALLGAIGGSAQKIVASLDSFDADGFTLDFSAVDTKARFGFYLAIGEASA